jgi:hypothetical protein
MAIGKKSKSWQLRPFFSTKILCMCGHLISWSQNFDKSFQKISKTSRLETKKIKNSQNFLNSFVKIKRNFLEILFLNQKKCKNLKKREKWKTHNTKATHFDNLSIVNSTPPKTQCKLRVPLYLPTNTLLLGCNISYLAYWEILFWHIQITICDINGPN